MHFRIAMVRVREDRLEEAIEFQRYARHRLGGSMQLFHHIAQSLEEPLLFIHVIGFADYASLEAYMASDELKAVLADPRGVTWWSDSTAVMFESKLRAI